MTSGFGYTGGFVPSLPPVTGRPKPAAGLIPCRWCATPFHKKKGNQAYCSHTCRQRSFENRQVASKALPKALFDRCVDLVVDGLITWDQIPPIRCLALAVEGVTSERWLRMAQSLRLEWVIERQVWIVNRENGHGRAETQD